MIHRDPHRTVLPALALLGALAFAAPSAHAVVYGEALAGNTTFYAESIFLGPPDDVFAGLGGQSVTYDLGPTIRLSDGDGADLQIYEADRGRPEFGQLLDILVSLDGLAWFSIKATESAAVIAEGDEAHGPLRFARSYDLATSGIDAVRYIHLDGRGDAPAGRDTGFDLDAIALLNFNDDAGRIEVYDPHPPHTPEPATLTLLGLGAATLLRRRKRTR